MKNQKTLIEAIESGAYGPCLIDEPFKKHTTFKIGGPCDRMVMPKTEEDLSRLLKDLTDQAVPFFILGNGSNLLVSDQGMRKTVIKLDENFSGIKRCGDDLIVRSGTMVSALSRYAMREGLSGFEALSGIPGTVGGGITMNAGAYGSEMKDVVHSVEVMDIRGQKKRLSNGDMKFAYRTSIIQEGGLIVTSVRFSLTPDDPKAIEARMADFTERRTSKQPLDHPSAGSVFKRPEGYFAGKLVDDAGLRGYRHKGAQVSEKHCGFIINTGGATCQDVTELIAIIQEKVKEHSGVDLEPEIRVRGD